MVLEELTSAATAAPKVVYLEEETSAWDIFATVWIGFVSYVILILDVASFYIMRNRPMQELQQKNLPMLWTSSVCGLVWMWSLFVSNEHLPMFRGIQANNCAMWTVWGQYFFGLNMWLTLVNLRLNVYYTTFIAHSVNKKRRDLLLFLFLTLPMFIVCIVIQAQHKTFYTVFEGTGFCNIEPLPQTTILMFLGLNVFVMMFFFASAKRWRLHTLNERPGIMKTIFVIVLAGLVITVLNIVKWTLFVEGRVTVTVVASLCVLLYYYFTIGDVLLKQLIRFFGWSRSTRQRGRSGASSDVESQRSGLVNAAVGDDVDDDEYERTINDAARLSRTGRTFHSQSWQDIILENKKIDDFKTLREDEDGWEHFSSWCKLPLTIKITRTDINKCSPSEADRMLLVDHLPKEVLYATKDLIECLIKVKNYDRASNSVTRSFVADELITNHVLESAPRLVRLPQSVMYELKKPKQDHSSVYLMNDFETWLVNILERHVWPMYQAHEYGLQQFYRLWNMKKDIPFVASRNGLLLEDTYAVASSSSSQTQSTLKKRNVASRGGAGGDSNNNTNANKDEDNDG